MISNLVSFCALLTFTTCYPDYRHLIYPSYPNYEGLYDSSQSHLVTSNWSTTVPFWPHYPYRNVQVLDGEWYYGYGGSKWNLSQIISPQQMIDLTPNVTIVPSAFDVAHVGYLGPRGTSFYRAYFNVPPKHKILVYFSACSFYCQLYIDGTYINDHRAGGYQAFSFEVDASVLWTNSTNHEIFVVVDNRFSKETAPTHTGGDFYEYGGITRNVLVHTLPNVTDSDNNFLKRVEVFPIDIDNGLINVNVVFGHNLTSDETMNFNFVFDGDNSNTKTYSGKISGNNKNTIQFFNISVPNFKVWDITSPNLHVLEVDWIDDNKNILDAIQARFGIRVIGKVKQSFSNGTEYYRLTINNKIVKLHGVNRHTMWNNTGSALNMSQIHEDVALLLDLNVNFVRGAHYPQDQRYLDLLDESGIMLWSETLGPDVSVNDLESPYFLKYQVEAVNEMIDQSINNPCVIFWAFYNEGPSNNISACPGYNVSANAIRSRDYTRFITWANDHRVSDVCITPVNADMVSFNSYPGWYSETGNTTYPYVFWSQEATEAHKKWSNKPFMISETGASGIWEYMNSTDIQWSQLLESEIVYSDLDIALNDDLISGITLWQFADIKANDGATQSCGSCDYYPNTNNCSYINTDCNRPGGENHKGQVDFWRRIKMSFNTTKKFYTTYSKYG